MSHLIHPSDYGQEAILYCDEMHASRPLGSDILQHCAVMANGAHAIRSLLPFADSRFSGEDRNPARVQASITLKVYCACQYCMKIGLCRLSLDGGAPKHKKRSSVRSSPGAKAVGEEQLPRGQECSGMEHARVVQGCPAEHILDGAQRKAFTHHAAFS
jgi:hypothetical protein